MCEECEKSKIYRKNYYEANKERIKKQVADQYKKKKEEKAVKMKEYRELHKEEIRAKAKEKVMCECGGRYTLGNKSKHMLSKRHKGFELGSV
jgi:hypothetical protein